MTTSTNGQPTIVRTERGLTVAGTRTTLYAILDYVKADWPAKLIAEWLNLSDAQTADALAYIAANREAVEKEYATIVQAAEDSKQYWESRNRDRAAIHPADLPPDRAALRAKLNAWKSKLEQS